MRQVIVCVVACSVSLLVSGEEILLEQLEAEVKMSPSVRASQAELDYRTSLLSREETRSSWSVISGVSLARQADRIVGDDFSGSFPARGYVGLTVPLLGSSADDARALTETVQDVAIQAAQVEIRNAQSLLALRNYYVLYWTSQQQLAALDRLQTSLRGYDRKLQARLNEQLLLASEYYQFKSTLSRLDRERAVFELVRQRALAQLNWLTSRQLTGFTARSPKYPSLCMDVSTVQDSWLNKAPRLKQAEQELYQQANQISDSRWTGIESRFSLVQSFEQRLRVDDVDSQQLELRASLDVSLPLNWLEYRREADRSRVSAWESGRAALENEQVNEIVALLISYEDLMQQRYRYRSAMSDLLTQNERLREVQLRFEASQSVELIQYINTHIDYYRSVIGWLDSRSELAMAVNEWQPKADFNCANQWQFTPDGGRDDLLLADTQGKQSPPLASKRLSGYLSRDLFVWKATDLLEELSTDRDLFGQLRQKSGITSIAISFTAEEIESFASQPFRLIPLFLNAERAGVAVNLLLGDPGWILPEGRSGLLDILDKLKNLPFSRLYLDLELNQLVQDDQLEGEGHWEALVDTLTAAVNVSPWPVAWITHDRYVTGSSVECRLCQILEAGVEQVSLMIFSTSPETVVRRAQFLLEANPELEFSLVVSVESDLPQINSFYHKGNLALELALAQIGGRLTSSNFHGFHLQSWSSYREMSP